MGHYNKLRVAYNNCLHVKLDFSKYGAWEMSVGDAVLTFGEIQFLSFNVYFSNKATDLQQQNNFTNIILTQKQG